MGKQAVTTTRTAINLPDELNRKIERTQFEILEDTRRRVSKQEVIIQILKTHYQNLEKA